jgi:hypothetical protein
MNATFAICPATLSLREMPGWSVRCRPYGCGVTQRHPFVHCREPAERHVYYHQHFAAFDIRMERRVSHDASTLQVVKTR